MNEYNIHKGENGLTVIEVPAVGAQSVTVLAMVPIGSRYEEDPVWGGAHFLEHMLFKGTKKRPKAIDISRVLDKVGADFNAFTSKEYTGFYVKVGKSFGGQAVELLDDMLYGSLLAEDEFERERGVIVEEIRMYEDTPMRHVHDLIDESLYPDSRLGRNIAGSEDAIRGMKLDDLRAFWNHHYSASNMVVVVAGATDGMFDQIKNSFGSRPLVDTPKQKFDPAPVPGARMPVVQNKETDQAHVVLAFPTFGYGNTDESILAVMRNVLGGTMSSRLFTEVREKRGLAYSVSAGADYYRDTGNLQVYAGLDRNRLPEALKVIFEQLGLMGEKGITDQELQEAKSNIAGKLALRMEDHNNAANWYANDFLFYQNTRTPEEYLKQISQVSADQVQQLAKSIIRKENLASAFIGPQSEEEFRSLVANNNL